MLIEGASDNTVGGTTAAATQRDLGERVGNPAGWFDGDAATVSKGTTSGPTAREPLPLGNEINGIIISNNASDNTIGGTASAQGNTIAFNVAAGVSVQSGTGDSILSNSIFSNGHLGIDLVAAGDPSDGVTPNQPGVRNGPNDLQNYPVIDSAVSGNIGSIQATLNSLPNTSFPDPVFHQSRALIRSATDRARRWSARWLSRPMPTAMPTINLEVPSACRQTAGSPPRQPMKAPATLRSFRGASRRRR